MDTDFWLERWRQGQTGFHMKKTTPLLAKYWPALGVPRGSRVLVPLCGKSLDMIWLAGQGHRVMGVELSSLAVEQFFAENQLTPKVSAAPAGTLYSAGDIEILCGDIFALGSTLVTAYVRHKHMTDLYAGASAVVLAVVWVYYSAQVFFFGACIGAALREDRS